jgi:hypothetical protein
VGKMLELPELQTLVVEVVELLLILVTALQEAKVVVALLLFHT